MAISKTSFKPGICPNPGGRPRNITHIRELARTQTVAALNTLIEIMNNTDAKDTARIAAANSLIERGWGKPEQAVSLTQVDIPVEKMTTQQLYAMLLELEQQTDLDEKISDA